MGKPLKIQWKHGGDHDKMIKKLIKEGKIHKFTKPLALKASHPSLFGEFSLQVIRNHLNGLKRSSGLFLDGESGCEDDDDDDEVAKEFAMKDSSIDSNSNANSNVSVASSSSGFNNIHQNYPVLCEVYKDPDTQYEKVILVISIPSGGGTPTIDISDDGMTAIVKYTWPRTLYNMEDLFKKQLDSNEFNGHHPKVLCLKSGLRNVRQRIDMAPESFVKVNLPIKVQTEANAWTKSGVRRGDGTQIVMAEFKGYVSDYAKKLSDSKIVFY